MRIGSKIPVLAGAVGATMILACSSAYAHAGVVFTIGSNASAGVPTPFTWSTRKPSMGSSLYVQRQEGTGQVWRTVINLGQRSSGSGAIPALAIGSYHLRIADIAGHAKVVAQQQRALEVFGDVPFSKLFQSSGGVYTTATGIFPYVMEDYDGRVNYTWFTVTANPCRSVHLEFIPGLSQDQSNEDPSGQHGTMTLVQQSADPVSVTAAGNSTGVITAQVVPGQSWGINVAQVEQGEDDLLFTWYVNGSANCDSTSLVAASSPGF